MAYTKKRSSPSIVISKKKTSSTVKRSSASQGVTIHGWDDDDWGKESDFLILVKKTGYYNFSLNGKQYFCDERKDTSKITNEVLFYAFNGGKNAQDKKKKKKGKITITKK